MFGTWKFDPQTDEMHNLRCAFDPLTARSSQHQACNRCHEKKLKCSGDKNGCDRCAASGRVCVYDRPGSRSSRKGKQTSRDSGESSRSAHDAGGTSSSRSSPRSRLSSPPSRHTSRSGNRPSLQSRQTTSPAQTTTALTSYPGTDGSHQMASGANNLSTVPVFGEEAYGAAAATTSMFSQQHYNQAASLNMHNWTTGSDESAAGTPAGLGLGSTTYQNPNAQAFNFSSYDAYYDFDLTSTLILSTGLTTHVDGASNVVMRYICLCGSGRRGGHRADDIFAKKTQSIENKHEYSDTSQTRRRASYVGSSFTELFQNNVGASLHFQESGKGRA